MELEITRPLWLFALLVLLPVFYYARRTLVQHGLAQRAASLGLRGLVIAFLVLAGAGTAIQTQSRQQFVLFAVDSSRSITEEARRKAETFVAEALSHAGSHLSLTRHFAEELGDQAKGNQTNLEAAISAAGALVPADCVPKLVLLCDGNQTLGNAQAAARASAMPIFTVPLPGRPTHEVYIEAIQVPKEVRQGQPFDVEVIVHSTYSGSGAIELLDDARREIDLVEGENRLRFPFTANQQPQMTFTARLTGFKDAYPENNEARAVVSVLGKPRVLLVDSQVDRADDLAKALEPEQIDVDVIPPDSMPVQLQKYQVVILSNLPATLLPTERMEAIGQYVGELGGGLIVVGGDRAFTAGGYRGTLLEKILPVVSEPTRDRPKPRLAMVLLIDRSASMQGRGIELAKQAMHQAVESLGSADQVGILAFDDRSQWVSEIRLCSDRNKQRLSEQIDTIRVEVGTNMFPAMEQAYLALREAYAELKHMIVLSDGLSHPGDFHALAEEIHTEGITISTVGVGDEVVGVLLQEIARLGGGHYYACRDAAEVPDVFAMETVRAGEVGVVEGPFSPRIVDRSKWPAEWSEGAMPSLLGYVQTRLKPEAQLLLSATDDDPLLAYQPYGQGAAVAFTSALHGHWAAAWTRWPGRGPFWGQIVRQVMRQGESVGLAQSRMTETDYAAELQLLPSDTDLLRSVAMLSGGQFDPKVADIFAENGQSVPRTVPLGPYLLLAAVLLWLVDLVLKRVDFPAKKHPNVPGGPQNA